MLVCARCGRESADDARFCAGCAAPLGEEGPRREERKVVSVVFVDLVGSTAQAERLDMEDVRAKLAAYHGRVRSELERHGGTVEKFIGDAVVAVFGAPVVHEDDAERAVRAALAIRDSVAGPDVSLRIAVNTGEALVTLDARPAEGEGMVTGDVINTAARLQSAAPVDGILVGEGTYRATAQAIEYRPVEPLVAKGKSEPIAAWEAVAARSRFGSDLEQAPPAALVGRGREVGLLRDTLARSRGERSPQLLTLIGVPGIGKSRLVTELFRIADEDPDLITWRQGRCLPYGDGISFWALGEMVKAQAGVLEGDSVEQIAIKLEAAVQALLPRADEAAWVIGHLRPLLGLSGDARGGADGRGETFAAWRRFLEGVAEHGPTVLVFEDLHWGDDGLLDFVDGLVDRASGVPLLVVCSARPELLTRRPGWGGGKANALTLSLSALSDEDTTRLISELLEQAALPAEMQQTLIRRAEGNPLFAEEYIRMLRDRGLLRRDGDIWRLDDAEVDVPETVQGIIAARIDALTTEEKTLLQDAAVIGKVFWLGAVATIADLSAWEAEEVLHGLERKEFVRRERRASVAGETEYAFRHVLVRDVAYGQIPRARRADVHVRTGEWIEALAATGSEDSAEMLAHHYVAALELTRAAGVDDEDVKLRARLALRDAGDRAYGLSALDAAVRSYRAALELWPEEDDERPLLLLAIGRALTMRESGGRAELTEASAALLRLGDLESAGDAEALLGETAWIEGSQEEAQAHYERAVELLAGLPTSPTTLFARTSFWRMQVLAHLGPSLEEGEQILALAESVGVTELELHARINLGLGRFITGDPDGSMEDLGRALADALEANSHVATRAYANLASHSASLGDLARSSDLHREGLIVAHRFGSALDRWLVAECLLDDYHAGEWERAEAGAREFIDATAASPHYMTGGAHYILAAVALAKGDPVVARREADRALVLGRQIADPQALWPLMAGAAAAALECGDRPAAVGLVEELECELAAAERFELELYVVTGFVVAALLGRVDALAAHLGKVSFHSPWVEACELVAAGDLSGAAEILASRGALAQSAYIELLAAERGETSVGLDRAVAFFERVGASGFLARVASLEARTA